MRYWINKFIRSLSRFPESRGSHVLLSYAHQRWIVVVLAALFLTPSLRAEFKRPQLDRNSPEGQFIELVMLETDGAKKTALLEQFLTMFPKVDPSVTAWVYGELQERYRRAGALDKAISTGEK